MSPLLSRLTLKKRFFLICFTITGLVLLLTVAGWQGFDVIQQKAKITSGIENKARYLQYMVRGLAEMALTEGTHAPRQIVLNAVKDFEATYNFVLPMVQSSVIRQALAEEIYPQWLTFKKKAMDFVAKKNISAYDVQSMIDYGRLSVEADRLLQKIQKTAEMEESFANAVISRTLAKVSVLAGGTILLTWLILTLTYRHVARPLEGFAHRARQAAAGDLSVDFLTKRNDEIGVVAAAFQEMTQNLRTMLHNAQLMTGDLGDATDLIRSSGTRTSQAVDVQSQVVLNTTDSIQKIDDAMTTITTGAEELRRLSEDTAQAVETIAFSIQNIANDSAIYHNATDETAAWIEQLVRSVESVAQNIEVLGAVSQETSAALTEIESSIQTVRNKVDESTSMVEQVSADATENGLTAIGAAVEGMEEIRTSIDSLTQVLNGLGQRSQEIGRFTAVIDEIADQTQLLSLNAAILAAQAGEYGGPFTVVAEEVKNLARHTTESTREISGLARDVQNETRSSINLVNAGTKTVENGMALVQQASRVFESINSRSQTNAELSREMRNMVHDQAERIQQGAQSTKRMAEHIEKIVIATREQNSGTRKIMEAMQGTQEIFARISKATEQQSQSSQVILERSRQVTYQAAQITGNIKIQKEKSAVVLHDMESIRETNQQITASAGVLNESLARLKEDTDILEQNMGKYVASDNLLLDRE